MDTNRTDKEKKARRRVEQLKGFYTHAMVYVAINTMIIIVKIVGTSYHGETFMGPFWHFSTFATPIFWGIGLFLHGVKAFGLNPFFNKDWEKRQIEKYMEEDEKEIEKYKSDSHGK